MEDLIGQRAHLINREPKWAPGPPLSWPDGVYIESGAEGIITRMEKHGEYSWYVIELAPGAEVNLYPTDKGRRWELVGDSK